MAKIGATYYTDKLYCEAEVIRVYKDAEGREMCDVAIDPSNPWAAGYKDSEGNKGRHTLPVAELGMEVTERTAKLVAAVKAHAKKNYERGGWDIVVECYSEADIARVMGEAKTVKEAIRNVKEICGIHDERRMAMAEDF